MSSPKAITIYLYRTGLDPRDREGFTIPLEKALAKLRDLLPGEAGTDLVVDHVVQGVGDAV